MISCDFSCLLLFVLLFFVRSAKCKNSTKCKQTTFETSLHAADFLPNLYET